MNTGSYCNKFSVFLSCILIVGVIMVLSQEHLRLDTVRIKVKEYEVKNLKSSMTNDAHETINQITVESDSHFNNSTTRISHTASNDIFKVQMKPDLMKLINPAIPKFAITVNGSYLLENKNRCSSVLNLTILMMVLSSPKKSQRRNAIRETWANDSFYSSYGTVRVLFLLGTINDTEVQDNILREFKVYGDIVQGSFVDSYRNLSHKSVMGYKWVTERCRNARYVMKTDDDLVINMFRILQNDINMLSVNKYHVHCLRPKINTISREKSYKWYVEPNQFKGMKIYPPYCKGQYVMILNEVVPYLYEAACHTPFFWIDDVFMYGLVMSNIPALKYKEIKWKDYGKYSDSTSVHCSRRDQANCRYLYLGTGDSDQILSVWSVIKKQYI